MPHRLKMIVGTASMIVMEARNFMTKFRLLEMMDAKVSDIFMRMLEYISTISIACLFSMMTSSRRSSSSSYILMRWWSDVLRRRRMSRSMTMPLLRRADVKYVKDFCNSRRRKNSLLRMEWRRISSMSSVRRLICIK